MKATRRRTIAWAALAGLAWIIPVPAQDGPGAEAGGQPPAWRHRGGLAGGPPPPGGPDMEAPPDGPEALLMRLLTNPRVREELKITDEQVAVLRERGLTIHQELATLRAAMEKAAIEQARLLTRDPVDEAAVMAAVEETGRVRTEVAKLRMRELLLIRQTFTPEQLTRARERFREHMQRRRAAEGPEGEGRRVPNVRREGPAWGDGAFPDRLRDRREHWRRGGTPGQGAAPPAE